MHQIEVVKWIDAIGDGKGWETKDNLDDEDYVVSSVGYVVKETDKYLTLAMDLGPGDGQTNGRGRIPKGIIISRKVIAEEAT